LLSVDRSARRTIGAALVVDALFVAEIILGSVALAGPSLTMPNEYKSGEARGVINRYRSRLPVTERTPVVSLGEGDTPLLHATRLSETIGRGCEVYLKCEGLNPTGSFKDRGMTVAVSRALERGARTLICASTGNTSASAATYAARAGVGCAVILPAGKIASGKMAQAFACGAQVILVEGNFDDALRLVRALGQREDFAIVNSINPDRIEGQKTAAFEIVDELGAAPEFHLLPVGNGGNITANWAGYREYEEAKKIGRAPRMIGVQAEGAAPIFRKAVVTHPETIATAIRIGDPANWSHAVRAIEDSGGAIGVVSDKEILEAQLWLARTEGIFVEPASAAPIAGLRRMITTPNQSWPGGPIPEGSRIVCTLTGHGLKDPDIIALNVTIPAAIQPDESEVLRALDRSRS
jgi:threonine synthase